MQRIRIHSHSWEATLAIRKILWAIADLVGEIRQLFLAARPKGVHLQGRRGPGKGNPKQRASLRNAWARYTPAQKARRMAIINAGRARRLERIAVERAASPAAGSAAAAAAARLTTREAR